LIRAIDPELTDQPFSTDLDAPEESRLMLASLRAHADEIARLAQSVNSALADDESRNARDVIGQIATHTIPRWHFAMLNDTERNDALAVALERRVRPGSHVLDIGAGTGLLAMMAARAGAGRVTTCEANPLLAEIARRVVDAHGLSDVITVIPKRSTELRVGVELERPADLVVSEIVDCGLIGEGLLPTMRHVREHLLAPGGQLLPRSGRLLGFLIESKVITGLNRVSNAGGFDVRLLNTVATRGHFPVRLRTWPHRVLSETVELASFDLVHGSLEDGSRWVRFPVTAAGEAHALVAWFEMDLGAGVMIRNSPENLGSHWMQALMSFEHPVPVSAGGRLDLELSWQDESLNAHC
jgi:predicted RNA methylase